MAESGPLPVCAAALAYSQAHDGVALLVLQDGKIRCASSDIAEPQELWSGTKSLVGLMAAAAVQDGLLTLDERAADTLGEWRDDPERSKITLRQLLSMTGGQTSSVGRPAGYQDSLNAPLTSAPGSMFQYGPAPMQIFGEIMRRKLLAKGEDGNPRTYIERRILTPLGVRIAAWRNGPDGAPLMPQGLVLSAVEWAKIGEFVRAGGRLNGKPLVEPAAFADLFKGSRANPAYGLTWWLPRPSPATDPVTRSTDITLHAAELPADMVVAAGAGDQRLFVIPSRRITIVRQARLDLTALADGRKSGWSDSHFLNLLLAR
ncbi:serine hydrolase [Sphingomonas sp. AOB5]|uniref:serine hydrolase domain-containing protein n=1 Tax=Sphingomonas sp. AOB5 TaxID=3034017 RepID=UPI0023F6B9C2|nr:serine hydrolase domain-containing protein [Sphingomonas sp. AOB5]MDF7775650.1 serine hydrolase [Sphingomonas sp. AOB5]